MIWGDISRSVNGENVLGENVLGGVAYKNKYIYVVCVWGGGGGGLELPAFLVRENISV